MLTAEIIAVGSELLTPEKTDTNSLWLTEKLMGIGVEVKLKTIVGDDEARLEVNQPVLASRWRRIFRPSREVQAREPRFFSKTARVPSNTK